MMYCIHKSNAQNTSILTLSGVNERHIFSCVHRSLYD